VKTISLLGSGEFETWAEELDRLALGTSKDGSTVAVILVGGDALDDRSEHARAHYRNVGAAPVIVPIRTRADAFVDSMRETVSRSCMVHLSARDAAAGVRLLLGTPLWDAILEAIEAGAGFSAADAALAALGEATCDDAGSALWDDWPRGLRLLSDTMLIPHWDAFGRDHPDLQQFLAREVPADSTLIGVDDRTALIGDGDLWQVKGAGQVQIRIGDVWNTYGEGAAFLLPSSVTVLPEAEEETAGQGVVVISDSPSSGPDQEPDLLVG
jgi:cyanophycinase-like exopeptidase